MTKKDVVDILLQDKKLDPQCEIAKAYAPSNIALAKYWGKRDTVLNLPYTNSLSISLGDKGTTTRIKEAKQEDSFLLNGNPIEKNTDFHERLKKFLDLFRPHSNFYFSIETDSNIPVAAGLASSASGFAALTLALNDFFAWNLPKSSLSIIARMGSGSACRSLWQGFVEWKKGERVDGMDSFAEPIPAKWPNLRIGLLLLNSEKKAISSREAMKQTVLTSPLYAEWPNNVSKTLIDLHKAIETQDFKLLGSAAEANAVAMHKTMLTAIPSINYSNTDTLNAIQKIQHLREEGLEVYFTQDAGPNLKLLYLEHNQRNLKSQFPNLFTLNFWI